MEEQGVSYFGPGPAKIPNKVLLELRDNLVNYEDSNISVLEISHRSPKFEELLMDTDKLVRNILCVPSDYKVLFFQGGGVGQFAAVPLNFMAKTGKADYIVTGAWSFKAAEEARKYGNVNLVLPPSKTFTNIPQDFNYSQDASYVYYCDNETIDGIEFPFIPDNPHGVPLVCDMSSNLFSRPVDVSKYGLIFGGAQKNFGTAGVTIVIVKLSLLGSQFKYCPSVFSYAQMAKANSVLNTPPIFAIHVVRKVLQYLSNVGGIAKMEENAKEKASLLYEFIDSSKGFYKSTVDPRCRSRMNVVFRIGGGNSVLEGKFISDATKLNLLGLKGHRSVGGIRASLYNAITIQDVGRLVDFMVKFSANNVL